MSMRTDSMRSDSVAQSDIDDYNNEKQEMHAQLQALKNSAESGDPDFHKKLDELIAKTSQIQNIQKTNSVQSFIEEGAEYTENRA